MLTINKPITLTLEPNDLGVVLDALSEKPYKIAQPVMERIVAQIRAQTEVPRDYEGEKLADVVSSNSGNAHGSTSFEKPQGN